MEETSAPVLFRASKKRKTYRYRPGDSNDAQASSVATPGPTTTTPLLNETAVLPADGDEDEDEGLSAVTAAMRARRARSRPVGVGFTSHVARGEGSGQVVLSQGSDSEDGEEAATSKLGMAHRFSHQTGLIPDMNDKHM